MNQYNDDKVAETVNRELKVLCTKLDYIKDMTDRIDKTVSLVKNRMTSLEKETLLFDHKIKTIESHVKSFNNKIGILESIIERGKGIVIVATGLSGLLSIIVLFRSLF